MLREWVSRHRGAVAAGASGAVVVALVATVAITFPGFTAQRLHLDDGSVWVANNEAQAIGRANPGVLELNTVIETGVATGTVVQAGGTVLLVDPMNATLDIVDPVDAGLGERVALPPDRPRVLLAGDQAVIHSEGTGELWVVPLLELDGFDPASPAVLALGEDSIVSLDDDGTLFAVAPLLGEVYRLELAGGGRAAESWSFDPDQSADDYQLTSVAGRWAVLDPSGGRLVVESGVVPLGGSLPLGADPRLQEPSAGGSDVLVATGSGLLRVPLDGGTPEVLVDGVGGRPAPPIVDGDCVFAAWTAGSAWRECAGTAAESLALAEMPGNAVLAFARNAGQIVLNDGHGGASWAVGDRGQLIDNWDELITPDEEREEVVHDQDIPPELDPQQLPPVAVDDEFGARPGRATLLPVLLNDYDPNDDVLIISDVEAIDEATGRIDLVTRNQQLQLTLEPDASGRFSFRYTITDGRGGVASAIVTVIVRSDDENSPPRQMRLSRVDVALGARTSTSVIGDWYDPDGDPFYLTSASTAAPSSVSSKPDGIVVFSDGGESAGRATVALTMSDGRDTATGSLEVQLRPRGEVPIVVEPWVVLATAGEEVTIRPLSHVRGGTGAIRLAAVPEKPGVSVTPSFETGTFLMSTERVGTHYIGFTVTDGEETAAGLVRVEVAAPPEAGARPITVPQTVFVRTLESATADPTLTDIDPAGGVLVVTGVTDVPAHSGIRAEILDQRQVRVTLGAPLDDGPVTLKYRISNGVADAEGTITVVEIPETVRVQAPIANDDAVTVRVGDVVDIPVLDNDEQPDGQSIELLPVLAEELPRNGGLLFASGGRLRYLAPDVAGNYSAVYSIRGADGQTAQATVRLSVREVDEATNSAPLPRTVTARVLAGETVQIEVPLSAVDPDGDAVQLIGVASNPEKGTVVSTLGSTISYRAGAYSSGTDVFRYTVVDGLGARAEGTVRVGISPRLEGARNPVANEDVVSVRPGRTISVQALANDSDPDGSPLRVIAATPTIDDGQLEVDIVDEAIVRIRPPEAPGRYSVQYTIENQYGGTSTNFVTVTVDPDAPLAVPLARDSVLTVAEVLDHAEVDVDVLANVFFADGEVGELALELVPGYSRSAEVLPGGIVRVAIEGASQIIPFSVAHPDDPEVRGHAFVWVPGYDDALPQLDPAAPELVVRSEETLHIEVAEQVVALGGASVRIADAATATATHSNGADLVVDEDTLAFTSADRYFGPASITFEVTDGTSADDPEGRRAVLTLPITVEPRENQPPVFIGADVNFEPGQSREFDLIRLTNYPYDDIDELAYTALDPLPEGFTAEINGQRIVVTAGLSTPTGTSSLARIAVRDAINEGQAGAIRLTVVPSTRPLARPAPDRAVTRRGQTTVVDVLANDEANNPFPGSPLSVVAIRGIDGASLPDGVTVTPSADRSRLTVQVAAGAAPIDTSLQYQVADVTGDPSRFVWGTATISVQDVPDPVTSVRVTEFADRSLKLSWTGGAANNSPISGYEVTATLVGSRSAHSTTSCTTTVGCTITTPGNGPDNAMRLSVVAINEIGSSSAVSNSGSIWSDIIPPRPTGLSWEPLDQGLAISWSKPSVSGSASPIERYLVRVAGETRVVVVDPSEPAGTSHTISISGIPGVRNGSSIDYSVSARNSAPNSLASWNSASGSGVPAWTPLVVGSPSASGVTSSSGTRVSAQWSDAFSANGRAITEYRVAISRGAVSPPCSAARPVGTSTSTEFTRLSPNRDYTVTIYASNGLGGCSDPATTTVIPRATPGTVTAIATGGAEPSGVGRWDFRLTSISNGSVPADHVQYRLSGSGVDGSASGVVPIGQGFLVTGNGSHYGTVTRAEFRACKVWPEVTLCSESWSAPFVLGTPVESTAPSGLTATVTETGTAFARGEWSWTAPPPGDYEAIQFRCGGRWETFAEGPSLCRARSGSPVPARLEIRITANGGERYARSYDWVDFD